MTQYYRKFSDYGTGDLSSVGAADWTRVVDSANWTEAVSATDFVETNSGTDGVQFFSFPAAETTGDLEIVCRFKIATAYNTTAYVFGPVLAAIASDEVNGITMVAGSSTEVRLTKCRYNTAGYANPLASSLDNANITYTTPADTYYCIRLGRYNTDYYRVKIWTGAFGDEPDTPTTGWMRDAQETTSPRTTLVPGLYVYKRFFGTTTFDAIGIGTAGDSAPTSAGASGVVPQARAHYARMRAG